jgi:hypothetical protein
MDVFGRELPCTFRPSSFGFARRYRWAIVSIIGGFAGSVDGINVESSWSSWSANFFGLPEAIAAARHGSCSSIIIGGPHGWQHARAAWIVPA